MTTLTDETLMRYADDLLEPAERERVARIAAQDAGVRARVMAFRATGGQLADLFDDFVGASHPVPRWAQNPIADRASAAHRDRVDWKRIMRSPLNGGSGRLAGPLLAASVALVVGFGLGWLLRADPSRSLEVAGGLVESRGTQLIAQGSLRQTLETIPSGAEGSLTDGRIRVRLSFQDEAGDYCREYELNVSALRHAGVACRRGADWAIAFQALVPPAPMTGSQIVPAGNSRSALDAATAALMIGDPLTQEGEARLLKNGWSK